jgi:hypothetical protein
MPLNPSDDVLLALSKLALNIGEKLYNAAHLLISTAIS